MTTKNTKQIILDTLASLGKEEEDENRSKQDDDAIPSEDQSNIACHATYEQLRNSDSEARESAEALVEPGWSQPRLRKYNSCFRRPVGTVGTLRKKGRLR
ncbi:MAG: hypothetical protein P1P90_06385 [Patescibacteria group bacterium]|nr:hypothetical protein [Patescibacteria group bacterium]